ncbi:MAG: aminoacyl-histidine dipeptidase [Lachnospiraceae bacterium]|nr:aminoacyl-histidine dipeptidase [Lachnospiraceae bacterium]
MNRLAGLEPAQVFTYFEEISRIPHGSGDTERISSYVESVLKANHLRYVRDEANNIIAWKDAAAGYENAPVVMLQGHLDMVNEKTTQSTHDFSRDPLELFVDGDEIGAKDTTLGGDDGIAVAYMLAILTDPSLAHPALECVFTVDEEIGLLGANVLDLSSCQAKYLINLDSEDEGIFLCGCAGGIREDLMLPIRKEEMEADFWKITIDNCHGGHSGMDIGKGRCNALLMAGRLLFDLEESGISYRLAVCEGGQKDNAIPRSSMLIVATEKDSEDSTLIADNVRYLFDGYKKEYLVSDPDMTVTVEETDAVPVMDLVSQIKVLFLLRMLPAGVQAMSQNIPGLVETSLNTGIMKTNEDCFTVSQSIRSNVNARKYELVNKLAFLVEYLGGEAGTRGDYPGWEFNPDSTLRVLMAETWKEMTGKDAAIEAIHAGLECGIISEKMPGIDIVSMGPDMKDIHTPTERLGISSTRRCYEFLLEVLKRIQN